jgi:Plavaka transposase
MDTLPAGPRWQSTIIEVDNYKTTDPISLIWCDGLEVVESIFGDPIFGADMTFDPILVNTPLGRAYDGWFSAREAHRIQACSRPFLSICT